MQSVVYYTDHYVNQLVTQFFSKSLNFKFQRISNFNKNNNINFCSYGILRGTGEAIKSSKILFILIMDFLNPLIGLLIKIRVLQLISSQDIFGL